MDTEKNESILGINSNVSSEILKVHLTQEVEINEKNKNDLPLTVKIKRGYNTVLNPNTQEFYDPLHMGVNL